MGLGSKGSRIFITLLFLVLSLWSPSVSPFCVIYSALRFMEWWLSEALQGEYTYLPLSRNRRVPFMARTAQDCKEGF